MKIFVIQKSKFGIHAANPHKFFFQMMLYSKNECIYLGGVLAVRKEKRNSLKYIDNLNESNYKLKAFYMHRTGKKDIIESCSSCCTKLKHSMCNERTSKIY